MSTRSVGLALSRADKLAIGPMYEPALITASRNLDSCTFRLKPHHHGVLAEPLHLMRTCPAALIQAVHGHELVPHQERCLRPDEHVADPAPIPATPLRAKTVDLAAADPNTPRKAPGCRFTQRLRENTNAASAMRTTRSTPSTARNANTILDLLHRLKAWLPRPPVRGPPGIVGAQRGKKNVPRPGCSESDWSVVTHSIDAPGNGQDRCVVLAWLDFDPVRIPDPEPPLRNCGDRVAVTFNLILVIDDVAVGAHVGAALDVNLESVTHSNEALWTVAFPPGRSISIVSRSRTLRSWILAAS